MDLTAIVLEVVDWMNLAQIGVTDGLLLHGNETSGCIKRQGIS
jgi:hypothetical protein